MNRIQLKVKIKSLASEARIIRLEEGRARSPELRYSLTEHRKGIVRYEARHSLLLYGYTHGKEYCQLEKYTKEDPDWKYIKKMSYRFGFVNTDEEVLDGWIERGKKWASYARKYRGQEPSEQPSLESQEEVGSPALLQ